MAFEHGPERAVYGVAVHTTGNGIPDQAAKQNKHPLEVARAVYDGMGLIGPHYVIDPYGTVEQYCDPKLVRYHIGLTADDRRSYLDGYWVDDRNRIDPKVVTWWKQRWPGIKSPSHLYPGKSANEAYVGVEMIPCGRLLPAPGMIKPTFRWEHGTRPGFDGQRFSVEQYVALARLCKQLAAAHGLDLAKPGVLVGHEDVNPKQRPGWDPGGYNGTFSWGLVTGLLAAVPA
jgi:hypothetical protein